MVSSTQFIKTPLGRRCPYFVTLPSECRFQQSKLPHSRARISKTLAAQCLGNFRRPVSQRSTSAFALNIPLLFSNALTVLSATLKLVLLVVVTSVSKRRATTV